MKQAGPPNGFDHNITEGDTLLVEIDYIHMNPVRRNLCQRATDWKWSSAGWYAGDRTGPLQIDPIPPECLFDCSDGETEAGPSRFST